MMLSLVLLSALHGGPVRADEASETTTEPRLGPAIEMRATTYEDLADLVCSYPWPCTEALAVMRCESTNNPRAYSQGNFGLYQINAIHRARVAGDLESLYDPEVNVSVAYAIWSEQGWSPWGCRGAAMAAR